MANYLFGSKQLDKGKPRRYAWFCGPERRLVEEVVDRYHTLVGAEEADVHRIDLADRDVADVWTAMNLYPVGERAFVLVRSAERIRDWEPFLEWDFSPLRSVHVCFVSNDDNVDTQAEHMVALRKHGHYIRCGPFTKHEDLVEVLQRHRAMEPEAADLLLWRTAGKVSAALDFLDKCAAFSPKDAVPYGVVERLVARSPGEDFVGALTEMRVKDAAEAAGSVPPTQYGSIVGMLDYRLDALARLHGALRRSTDMQDLARLTHLDMFVVRDLYRFVRMYDHSRLRVAVEALALVDSRISEGEDDLILETLTALWAA
jgi:hypothetical protein